MEAISGIEVFGCALNEKTGCAHYHSLLDIVAIKCKCCQRYYGCFFCHEQQEDHPLERWAYQDFDLKAILCGSCHRELSIQEYLSCNATCIHCQSSFNPACKEHWPLYFDFEKPADL